MTTIPLVDLSVQHEQIEAEVHEGFARIMQSGAYIQGAPVAEFEKSFAEFCEVAHCIGVANGTDALELALRALEVSAGDEIIVPANTFIASALAIARTGARPVFVDSDPEYHLIDVEQVAAKIGPRTKAVMAVDLFGQVAPMGELEKLTREAGISLLEDAAQSQGARQGGRRAGSFGDIAGTSFYPGKNLGAYGDAGAVMTQSDELADRVRVLGNYGSDIKYHHPRVGFNSRLDTLQAVVLNAKLSRLEKWNDQRLRAAAHYQAILSELKGVALPKTLPDNQNVHHIYAVRVDNRDRVLAQLHEFGIGAGIHYPVPLHLQGAFEDLGHRKGDFPICEQAAGEMISLPLFPGITHAQQGEVANALRRAMN